jgi:hypothetical protein
MRRGRGWIIGRNPSDVVLFIGGSIRVGVGVHEGAVQAGWLRSGSTRMHVVGSFLIHSLGSIYIYIYIEREREYLY